MEGPEFIEKIKSENSNQIYENVKVLSRSRPEDKYALVEGLQKNQHIVAVSGDGTNDAPALKKADVGVASDAILLDDNFYSFVRGIKWGRNVHETITKYLQFNVTMNFVVLLIMLLTCAIIKQETFKPIQIFLVNIIF